MSIFCEVMFTQISKLKKPLQRLRVNNKLIKREKIKQQQNISIIKKKKGTIEGVKQNQKKDKTENTNSKMLEIPPNI